jgi:flagellar hook-basal body complex protein FliE
MINGIGFDQRVGDLSANSGKGSRIETLDGEGLNFGELLKNSIGELNKTQKDSERAMTDMATGQVKDLHQAALAIDKAELSMKTMLEVRNKALNAYKEITRIQM